MKKLCRLIFSRYAVSALAILMEFFLMGCLLFFAYDYSLIAIGVIVAVSIITMLSLVNSDANPEYKVSWLIIIGLIPLFGTGLYLLFYSRRVPKKKAALMKKIRESLLDDGETQRNEMLCEIAQIDSAAKGKAAAILNDDGLSDIYTGTVSEFFSSGEDMYESMLGSISSAEKYIFLEYFIIGEGEMWSNIHKKLLEKAALGVEVRVMYDDVGCMKTLPSRYYRKLCAEGIKCKRFSPVTPRINLAHNNRDHRKILIIDGETAYTGGVNIADEYINKKSRFGYWKDGGIKLTGNACTGLLKQFLSMWDYSASKISDNSYYLSSVKKGSVSDGGFYVPFGSGPSPIYSRPVGKNVLLNIINQAKSYVYITTPYLIIDYDLTESLRNAAIRGVDVRIITPGTADKKLVKLMTKSAYPRLIEAGVNIYKYLPGFIHQKSVCSDDAYALIGTINLDYRSLVHHYEDAVWIYRSKTVIDVKESFLETVKNSVEISGKDARLTPFEWIIKNLIRIFAPLL